MSSCLDPYGCKQNTRTRSLEVLIWKRVSFVRSKSNVLSAYVSNFLTVFLGKSCLFCDKTGKSRVLSFHILKTRTQKNSPIGPGLIPETESYINVSTTVFSPPAVDQQAYGYHYEIKAWAKAYSCESPLNSTLQGYVNMDHYGEYRMSERQLNFSWCYHLH